MSISTGWGERFIELLAQQFTELTFQRQPVDLFDRAILTMSKIVLTAPGGASEQYPVGRTVAGPAKALRINKSFCEVYRVFIHSTPVVRQGGRHATEKVRGQMWHTDPWQDQKTCVVGDEPNVALAHFLTPADEPIPTAQMPWRRTPCHASDRPALGPDHIFQMLAHWLLITKIVVMFDKTIEQRLITGA